MAIRRINSISFLLKALSLKGNPFPVTIGAMNEYRYAAIRTFINIIKSVSHQGQNTLLDPEPCSYLLLMTIKTCVKACVKILDSYAIICYQI
jgi:hypothetical protein